MAYRYQNLSVLAYANGFTLWHYTADETPDDLTGYFDEGVDMFRIGDVIEFGTPNNHKRLLVTGVQGAGVMVQAL